MRFRGSLLWVAIVGAALGVALLAGRPASDGPPLDPSSTGPGGTKALVDTLRELGADLSVQSGPPGENATTALLLVDSLGDAEREALSRWVRVGGTLVLADPASPLNPADVGDPAAIGPLDPELERRCRMPALQQVERVAAPGAVLMSVPPGATGCFSRGEDAWLLVVPEGSGNLVVLGGAGALTNSQLDEADNAVLAAALLTPTLDADVAVVWVPQAGSGGETLVELVPQGVKLALLQLGVAFVVLALWRARRLGRPVVEAQAVSVDGSESVAAVGRLLQRARARSQAADILRDDVRRTLATRLGLPAGSPPEVVADVASATSGLGRERVVQALAGGDPTTEEALVVLAQSLDALGREVAHGS